MKIFKFGGASVKDAEGIKNIVKVLNHEGYTNTLLVISAMGKTTNALENIVEKYLANSNQLTTKVNELKLYHTSIITNLFENPLDAEPLLSEIDNTFELLSRFIRKNTSEDFNYVYDQVVSFGEILSTKIVSFYLEYSKITNEWLDIRNYIITDTNYREASVNWNSTCERLQKLQSDKLYLTQGFIGGSTQNSTTTLGREGSDYTAAIVAYCLNATSVTIWKDVDGVLSGDPRFFTDVELLHKISYEEAIEMAFYGASVIHPKTLKPLQNKSIPLIVRSFYNLSCKGTTVYNSVAIEPAVPCFIFKPNQILISISALDFSFIIESNISQIFKQLHDSKLKVNMIQNSALNFSVCVEDKFKTIDSFISSLQNSFTLSVAKNVSLYTIRHASQNAVEQLEKNKKVLLKQSTKGTVQLVIS